MAAHRLRGEGLTPKRIIEMVVINEYDEYLAIFPEDREHFTPYINQWGVLSLNTVSTLERNTHLTDKKEFALAVKDLFYSAILFQSRASGKDPIKVLHSQKNSYKVKLLEQQMRIYNEMQSST